MEECTDYVDGVQVYSNPTGTMWAHSKPGCSHLGELQACDYFYFHSESGKVAAHKWGNTLLIHVMNNERIVHVDTDDPRGVLSDGDATVGYHRRDGQRDSEHYSYFHALAAIDAGADDASASGGSYELSLSDARHGHEDQTVDRHGTVAWDGIWFSCGLDGSKEQP